MPEPIALERAKQHLRVVTDDEDGLISAYITAAREYAEKYQNRVFVSDEPDADIETPGELEKAAMLLIIGHLYENRETVVAGSTVAEVPLGAKSLLTFNRRWPV